ncbi:MAG: hypothetical protein H0U52_06080 [Chloroflexi bacterium]|nr:hypothetical protein [Chloroflexota bacterium]
MRLAIEATGNPLRAGEGAWITTTLRNTGRDTLRWMTDGCAIHVGAHGEMPFRWAKGFLQAGVAKTYKNWAYVANLPAPESPIWLSAVPERFVGKATFGCADLGVPHELAPSREVRQRHHWDGQAAPDLGLPPNGPAEWIGTFQTWWRQADPGAEFAENPRDPLLVRLPAGIVGGRDPGMLSAGQAIDVAVTVPALRALLEANPSIQDWDMPITTRFDHPRALWQIGLKTNDGFSVLVQIEPLTAAVVRVVQDPFPAP